MNIWQDYIPYREKLKTDPHCPSPIITIRPHIKNLKTNHARNLHLPYYLYTIHMTDAHNHLQDIRFDGMRAEIIETMRQVGITRCVVNGTCPSDWGMVAELATEYPDLIIPSFGLHPWHLTEIKTTPDWLDQLQHLIDTTPNACIGECGLDRGIVNYDIEQQTEVFTSQLQLAATRNLPLSIHCVRAWGLLIGLLESTPLPERGFLLHSYGGSTELIPRLVKLGAYFSFSGAILHPHKQKARNTFAKVPANRLLIETDAPDMLPPEKHIKHPLPNQSNQLTGLNHPANLTSTQRQATQFLDTSQLQSNFNALFKKDDGLNHL